MTKRKTWEETHIIRQPKLLAPEELDERQGWLVVVYGAEVMLGQKIVLPREGEVTIGRSSDCEIQITSFGVSRRHAAVQADAKGYTIRDLNSTNGTFINGVRIGSKPYRLQHGDRIQVGTAILKFLYGGDIELKYYEEIYRIATTDGLLRIPNRRYLLEQIDKEISRSRRHRRNLSLLIFDIDHFKRINDTYGHLAGDHVLREIAERIRYKIRKEDTFARYGGEEFIILMPEIPLSGAIVVGEKVRRLVAEKKFEYNGKQIFVTVSVGVASWSPEIETPEDLIAIADRRLYIAKRTGRNKVVAHD